MPQGGVRVPGGLGSGPQSEGMAGTWLNGEG